MISIGTPYFGSKVAEIAGPILYPPPPGVSEDDEEYGLSDINNEIIYNKYYNDWTAGYETKYKDINSIAIGGATTIYYLRKVLDEDGRGYAKALSNLLSWFGNASSQLFIENTTWALYPIATAAYPDIKIFTQSEFTELVEALSEEVHYGFWHSDVFVPADSQQGVSGDKNYYFTKYVKEFDYDNAALNPKRAVNELPIIHNLETYDADIHDYILKNIIMKEGDVIDNEISNVGKISYDSNRIAWQIKVRNVHSETREYAYNEKMCFFDDAKNWTGLTDISTFTLEPGETKIVNIESNGTATSIAISSILGNTRYIEYADNLWYHSNVMYRDTIFKMTCYSSVKSYNGYLTNKMKVRIVGKNGGAWIIDLTNQTGEARVFYYNLYMCFNDAAKEWSGLSHIQKTRSIADNETVRIIIYENGTATSIAISYTDGDVRKVFYANSLDPSCSMVCGSSEVEYNSYSVNGMTVSIVGKNDNTWLIDLTNKTGKNRIFYYNSRLCYAGDANNWLNLSDVKNIYLAKGATTEEPLEITENLTATSIAISYKDENGIQRKIFYANELDPDGTMKAYGNTKPQSYTQNGMKVMIVGKNGNTWTINLTNNTGEDRQFEYNTKMCYAGDAEKWSGLSDPGYVTLGNGKSKNIYITENLTATSIAISYIDDNYRKIFYANELDADDGTMNAYSSTIDTTNPPDDSCLAPGTLIMLADGSQKAVEDLTGDEMLLVWDMETGTFGSAPIVFVDSELTGHYEVITLTFSDNTTVEVISEHGFRDADLNKYVYLDENAEDYIGHSFLKESGDSMTEVVLTDVDISTEITEAYSPVTYGHLCYYVNGMLSMPGGIDGLFNIFDVDPDTLTIDEESYAADIAEYGLYTYEEFSEIFPVSEDVFEAFNGKYLKVAIGKGLITPDRIGELIERYSELF